MQGRLRCRWHPVLAPDGDANLVAAWVSSSTNGDGPLSLQVYDALGWPLGNAVQVGSTYPSTTSFDAFLTGVDVKNDNIVYIWSDGTALYGQRYSIE
jgi:hypothetical protein